MFRTFPWYALALCWAIGWFGGVARVASNPCHPNPAQPETSVAQTATGPGHSFLSLPHPLVIGGGLRFIRDLDEYRSAGFNTVYLRVEPAFRNKGWQAADDLLIACGRRELPVLVELSALPDPASGLRVSPYDEQYRLLAMDWLSEATTHLRRFPAVAGFVTQSRLQAHLSLTEQDFRSYLQASYGSLEAVGEAWGTNPMGELGWEQITFGHAQLVDNLRALGVGRSTLDIAQFRAHAVSELLSLWFGAIRRAERERPIFAGEEYLYRGLMCVPLGFAGVFTGMFPDEAEPDVLTHNVHAVDIARQAGSLAVIQSIRVSRVGLAAWDPGSAPGGATGSPFGGGGDGDPPLQEVLPSWITEALLHGAFGVSLDDWRLVATTQTLRAGLQEAVGSWMERVGEFSPKPNVAVLLEPFADGAVNNRGEGLFGFLEGFSSGEPSRLIFALRLGHRFGLVDYLTPQVLVHTNLSGYGVILIPQGLDIGDEVAAALTQYASAGGVVVADLGAGMYQGGSAAKIPLTLRTLFGILQIVNVRETSADFRVTRTVPPVPSWAPGQRSSGDPSGPAFRGPIGDAELAAGAVCFGEVRATRGRSGRTARSGLILKPVGSGFSIFSTARLFANFGKEGPEDPLLAAMFSDLFARRAVAEVLVEPRSGEGPKLIDEVFRRVTIAVGPGKIVLYNRLGTRQDFLLRVWSEPERVFWGAATVLGGISGSPCLLRLSLAPREITAIRPLPIAVDGSGLEVTAEEYSKARVAVRLAQSGGNGGGGGGTATMHVGTGEYPVSSGSTHRVRIEAETPEFSRQFSVSAGSDRIVIPDVPVPALVEMEPEIPAAAGDSIP